MTPAAGRPGRSAAGRALILGGVTIPSEFGLEGHSDADVLTLMLKAKGKLSHAEEVGDVVLHVAERDALPPGTSDPGFVLALAATL